MGGKRVDEIHARSRSGGARARKFARGGWSDRRALCANGSSSARGPRRAVQRAGASSYSPRPGPEQTRLDRCPMHVARSPRGRVIRRGLGFGRRRWDEPRAPCAPGGLRHGTWLVRRRSIADHRVPRSVAWARHASDATWNFLARMCLSWGCPPSGEAESAARARWTALSRRQLGGINTAHMAAATPTASLRIMHPDYPVAPWDTHGFVADVSVR